MIVDLEFMCETSEKFVENNIDAERITDVKDHKRVRPASIFNKYVHPLKPPKRKKGRDTNPLAFKEENMTWLADAWYERNQTTPTRSQILKGVINADKR